MTKYIKLAAVAGLGLGVLAFAGGAASARIVCNEDGDCWHSHEEFALLPGLTVHPDDWTWGDSHRYHWREHEGRGYWHGGEWRHVD